MNEKLRYIVDDVDIWWDDLFLHIQDGYKCVISFQLDISKDSRIFTCIYFNMSYDGGFYFDTTKGEFFILSDGHEYRLTNGEQETILNLIYNNIEKTIVTNPQGIKKLKSIIPPFISSKYPEIFSALNLGLL